MAWGEACSLAAASGVADSGVADCMIAGVSAEYGDWVVESSTSGSWNEEGSLGDSPWDKEVVL